MKYVVIFLIVLFFLFLVFLGAYSEGVFAATVDTEGGLILLTQEDFIAARTDIFSAETAVTFGNLHF